MVTESIGAATVTPWTTLDADGATTLVADAALYEAKRCVRDRLKTRGNIPCVGLPWADRIDQARRAVAAAAPGKTRAFTVH